MGYSTKVAFPLDRFQRRSLYRFPANIPIILGYRAACFVALLSGENERKEMNESSRHKIEQFLCVD